MRRTNVTKGATKRRCRAAATPRLDENADLRRARSALYHQYLHELSDELMQCQSFVDQELPIWESAIAELDDRVSPGREERFVQIVRRNGESKLDAVHADREAEQRGEATQRRKRRRNSTPVRSTERKAA